MLRVLFLSVMLLLVNVASAAALPPCQGSYYWNTWTNCEGAYTYDLLFGPEYAGGFRDNLRHGVRHQNIWDI